MSEPADPREKTRWPGWARWTAGLALLIILAVPLLVWGPQIAARFSNPEEVAAAIRNAGARGAVFMVLLQVLQVVVAPIPGQVINFAAGYVFGFIPGTLLSWVGTTLGAALAMTLARFLGRPLVERLISPTLLSRIDALVMDKGLPFFFVVFLIPFLPDDALCLAAGLTPLPLSALILAAAVGRLPALAASVWMGAHAGALPPAVLAAAGLLGVVLLVIAWRYGDRIEEALLVQVAKLKG